MTVMKRTYIQPSTIEESATISIAFMVPISNKVVDDGFSKGRQKFPPEEPDASEVQTNGWNGGIW